jgi:hypothetical protein
VLRGKSVQDVSEYVLRLTYVALRLGRDDLERAIHKLKGFGSGFDILTVGKRRLVRV